MSSVCHKSSEGVHQSFFRHYLGTISYFWLPEFSLFMIWMNERIKDKIAEIRSNMEEREEEVYKFKQKEVRKIFLLIFWIIVAVIISIIMVYIIFF